MAKQYFRKATDAAGENRWISMTGKEFYAFIHSAEGMNRWFIDMEDVVLETSKEEYVKWRKEKDRANYLQERQGSIVVLPLGTIEAEDGGNGENGVQDKTVNVEESALRRVNRSILHRALQELSPADRAIVGALYFVPEPLTERKLAQKLGVSQVAVHKRKKKILEKLKFLVIKIQKSSQ